METDLIGIRTEEPIDTVAREVARATSATTEDGGEAFWRFDWGDGTTGSIEQNRLFGLPEWDDMPQWDCQLWLTLRREDRDYDRLAAVARRVYDDLVAGTRFGLSLNIGGTTAAERPARPQARVS